MVREPKNKAKVLEEAFAGRADQKHHFKLYLVSGAKNSLRAIENLRALCEVYLADRYELEMIDVRKRPQAARRAQIVAAPTLVKELPLPIRRFIGDLSDVDRILWALDLSSTQE